MTKSTTSYEEWFGTTVYDRTGTKIGDITDIYLDDKTGQPEWMTVSTGWFGTAEQFVPIAGTRSHNDGLQIEFAKDQVKEAPSIDTGQEHLDAPEERRLYDHYGLDYDGSDHEATFAGRERADEGYDYNDTRSASAVTTEPSSASGAASTSALSGENEANPASVIRSEEELALDTVTTEAGRVRVRKYVVTDHVDIRVPIKRQVARIVREPSSGSGVIEGDSVEEIVLAEEQVVVQKHVVAKEKVSIETDTVIGEEIVSETLRRERVEIEEKIAPHEA